MRGQGGADRDDSRQWRRRCLVPGQAREVRPDRRASAGAGPFRRSGHSALTRGTEARTRPHSVTRPCRPARRGLRNLNRSFRRPSTEAACILSSAFHANSNDAFRQSDPSIARCTVPCSWASCWARPCPWRRKRWMPSGWRGRQHGRLARRCQPSRAGRADRFRQRDIARRRCGGGHRQHLCRAQARPDRHRRQRRLVRRAEHERGGFDGVVGRPGDRAPTTRITRFPIGARQGARAARRPRESAAVSRWVRTWSCGRLSSRRSPLMGPTRRRGQARRAWKWVGI